MFKYKHKCKNILPIIGLIIVFTSTANGTSDENDITKDALHTSLINQNSSDFIKGFSAHPQIASFKKR